MPKLPVLTSKQLVKKLKKIGFVEDRKSGNHLVMYHFKSKRRAVVPMHLKDLKRGTLHSILKEAGINRKELL